MAFALPSITLLLSLLIHPSVALSPQLEATIHAFNGTDITSAFQTMIYWAPQPDHIVATPELTGRRQREPSDARVLNSCSSPTAQFVGSYCRYKSGITGTIQQYIIYCQERPAAEQVVHPTKSHVPARVAEAGTCDSNELCMPGSRGIINGARYYTAVCVKKSSFQTPWSEKTGVMGSLSLENRTASIVLAEHDGQTPLEAGSMEISAIEAEGATVQDKNCTDCVEIATPPLPEKAEQLKMQAWLEEEKIRTLQAAGILYLILNVFIG